MQEEILHYIWKYCRFDKPHLKSVVGQEIRVIDPGQHNHDSGPDFFNSKIEINNQLWAGNVEIHINSSDWYNHKHHADLAYDNVILHVVWNHNSEVKRSNGSVIETLQLTDYVDSSLVDNYKLLMQSKSWINCERDFPDIDDFTLNSWLERLYFERLENKSQPIKDHLKTYKNNWEQVLFIILMKSFGLKVNSEAFESCAKTIDFSVIRKIRSSRFDLEALLFGQFNLLEASKTDAYQNELHQRYLYLNHKFKIKQSGVLPLKMSKMRPSNFPTIRLAQFASLYHSSDKLFAELMRLNTLDDIYKLLKVGTSEYWETHYNFLKASNHKTKELTKSFIDLIIINALIPLKFSYYQSIDKPFHDDLAGLVEKIPLEQNGIINRYMSLKMMPKNAMISQGLLQLKNQYCDKNACLSCPIAARLLL